MHFFIRLLFLLLVPVGLRAQQAGINWQQMPFGQVFDAAKSAGKPVVVYFHFKGCGACVKMDKTAFKDPEVVSFYNANFLCVSVNTRKGEGIEVNHIYNVQLHPTFLFFDRTGIEVHRAVGFYSPKDFLEQARLALDPEHALAYLKMKYGGGERSPDFLCEYCYRLRDAMELDSVVINEYLQTQVAEDYSSERNIRFIYEYSIHNFRIVVPHSSPVFEYMLTNREKFYAYYDREQVDTRIVWILNNAIYKAIAEQDEDLFRELIEKIRPFDSGKRYVLKAMDGRASGTVLRKHLVLSAEMEYYKPAGDETMYRQALDKYVKKIWDDAEELNNLAWEYATSTANADELEIALNCIKRSISLNSRFSNNQTYAVLLHKSGKDDKALKQAEKAVSLARKEGANESEMLVLIQQIRTKSP